MPWSWQQWNYERLPKRPRNPEELEPAKVQTLRAQLRRLELALPDPDALDAIADRWNGSPDAEYLRLIAARIRRYG